MKWMSGAPLEPLTTTTTVLLRDSVPMLLTAGAQTETLTTLLRIAPVSALIPPTAGARTRTLKLPRIAPISALMPPTAGARTRTLRLLRIAPVSALMPLTVGDQRETLRMSPVSLADPLLPTPLTAGAPRETLKSPVILLVLRTRLTSGAPTNLDLQSVQSVPTALVTAAVTVLRRTIALRRRMRK